MKQINLTKYEVGGLFTNWRIISSDFKSQYFGNSLVVQWLEVRVLTAKGPALIPGQETKILQAMRCGGKKTPSK